MNKLNCNTLCQPVLTNAITDDVTLQTWLIEQASKYRLQYLLAYATDGVIWGYFNDGKLSIAHGTFPQFPKLCLSTLQQCRIFGIDGEVLLWRTKQEWKARLIYDSPNKTQQLETITEDQVLWGTQGKVKDGFTLLSDGQQGLCHAVPLTGIQFDTQKKLRRPVRLKVRHYIEYDNDGLARIGLSRLVDLFAETKGK